LLIKSSIFSEMRHLSQNSNSQLFLIENVNLNHFQFIITIPSDRDGNEWKDVCNMFPTDQTSKYIWLQIMDSTSRERKKMLWFYSSSILESKTDYWISYLFVCIKIVWHLGGFSINSILQFLSKYWQKFNCSVSDFILE
jgi:hypothetical protein